MPSKSLQTVIVSKDVAKTRTKAELLARPHANRIYTSRETKVSWRFRQRPPSDFKKRSFRTFPVPGHPGIALVYGELKASAKKKKSASKFSYRCNPSDDWVSGDSGAAFRSPLFESRGKPYFWTVYYDEYENKWSLFKEVGRGKGDGGTYYHDDRESGNPWRSALKGEFKSFREAELAVPKKDRDKWVRDPEMEYRFRSNPEPPPLHKKSARTTIRQPSGVRRQKKVYRGWEDVEIEEPRKRSASEPPPFHKESAYLLLGRRKKVKNNPRGRRPGEQRHLQWKGTEHDSALRDWDFWLAIEPEVRKARSEKRLRELATITEDRDIKSDIIRHLIYGAIADRARALLTDEIRRVRYETRGKKRFRFLFAPPSPETDEKYVRALVHEKNPKPPPKKAKTKAKRSASKKKASQKSPRAKKLKAPRVMPDPGPCAWLGSTLELSFDRHGANPRWTKKGEKGRDIWSCGRREWMFLWSPKYKAVVVIPKPRGLRGGPGCAPRKVGKVVRDGGAALSFERFAARAAEATQEVEIPECKMQKLGDGVHIVYRSDKWSTSRKTTDYIHDYGKDVQIYCGPSIEKPEVFICFGGKLTLTERGLVF